jgi:hypothetical protein
MLFKGNVKYITPYCSVKIIFDATIKILLFVVFINKLNSKLYKLVSLLAIIYSKVALIVLFDVIMVFDWGFIYNNDKTLDAYEIILGRPLLLKEQVENDIKRVNINKI